MMNVKSNGDDYIQHCVMLWRKSKTYADWLPHMLSYISYEKLDSCMIWMQAIDSLAGSVPLNWEKKDEALIRSSLQTACKSISAIFHILGMLPRSKNIEYSLEWDDFSEEYVDVQFSPEIADAETHFPLSHQIMQLLKHDIEPMMISSIVGIVNPIEMLSIPFVDKNSMAHHFLDKGLNIHEVECILKDYLTILSPFHDLYPVQVTEYIEMYRFSDYDEKMKNFDANKEKFDSLRAEIQSWKDISHPKDMPFLEYVDTALDYDKRVLYYELEELISISEFQYNEGVDVAKYCGIYDSLHKATLAMFERHKEHQEAAF